MTSALYPYVHTQACGMSGARYSSGQKTVDGSGGAIDAGLEEGPCACAVAVAEDLSVRLNRDLRPLDFLVVLLPPLLALVLASASVLGTAAVSHVLRGCPRRPWTNTILQHVSRSLATCAKVALLQAELLVVLRAGSQPREAVSVHGRHARCGCECATRCREHRGAATLLESGFGHALSLQRRVY